MMLGKPSDLEAKPGHTLVVDGGATLISRARASDDQPADP
jgi:hypothetical protein|uniref:Uncharacterized protein n=1 Tax=uncultured Pseudomonadota bacterium TaxID=153809 RepID=A0A2P0QJE9_9PROT|nr:hypothetical protein [uncultured proteobacterium]|tara:strand:+ start:4115 stop:4234 length:120 start_codon:yes stop_codon:yes gene_type:complete